MMMMFRTTIMIMKGRPLLLSPAVKQLSSNFSAAATTTTTTSLLAVVVGRTRTLQQQQQQQQIPRFLLPTTTILPTAIATTSNSIRTLSTSVATEQEEENVVVTERELISILRLNNLQDNPGAVKKKRRVGRGIGSSKGKTCGKGHKGQRARNKSSIPYGFEGGQTKLYKLLPKRGFTNKRHKKTTNGQNNFVPLNLGTLQDYIDMGRFPQFDASEDANAIPIITIQDCMNAGLLKKTPSCSGVKLLANGKERFQTPIRLFVNRASEEAIAALEAIEGATITTVHFNRLAMRAHVRPEKFSLEALSKKHAHRMRRQQEEEEKEDSEANDDNETMTPLLTLPKQARPPPKLQTYYSSFKNRGYLCPQVQIRDWLLDVRPDLQESFENSLFGDNNA